jgi:hypothetical protein
MRRRQRRIRHPRPANPHQRRAQRTDSRDKKNSEVVIPRAQFARGICFSVWRGREKQIPHPLPRVRDDKHCTFGGDSSATT